MKAHYVFVLILLSLTACDGSSLRAKTDSGEKVQAFTETIEEKFGTANDQVIEMSKLGGGAKLLQIKNDLCCSGSGCICQSTCGQHQTDQGDC